MSPHRLFDTHEPRAVYPVFADRENRLSYVLRATYIPTPGAALRHAAGRIIRRDISYDAGFLARIVLDSFRTIRLRFRAAFLDRDGVLVGEIPEFATVRYLQGFNISINDELAKNGLPLCDGQLLLIADRGVKLDLGYSIGTVTAAYTGPDGFTCYRNAAFARPTNELGHHRPRGFRSIAPHMLLDEENEASAYFFNFSSDPDYDFCASPRVTLLRDDGECLKRDFGDIPPFGARERSLTALFGAEAREFLSGSGSYGTLIAEQEGVTIGSIHIIRNRRTHAMSIEHTRPTPMYVA